MKKKSSKIVIILIFLAGLSLLLYPFIANQWNNHRQKQLIGNYESVISDKEAAGNIDYAAEMKKAEAYNDALLPSILPDSFAVADASTETDSSYEDSLNIAGDGMMGIVEIPKIAIKLPIYHGTDDAVLQTAVGHLEWTSLPVGGESTHCVISGHRGLPSAKLFTSLDKLREGDTFLLRVLDEVLTYEVDQILIVEPQGTEALQIEEGEDYCTLMTCTPYGINTHRLLVRGHRIENAEEAREIRVTADAMQVDPFLVAPVVGVLLLLIILLASHCRRKR